MQNRPLPVGSGRFYNLHAATNQAVGARFAPPARYAITKSHAPMRKRVHPSLPLVTKGRWHGAAVTEGMRRCTFCRTAGWRSKTCNVLIPSVASGDSFPWSPREALVFCKPVGALCALASPFGGGVRAQRRTERVRVDPHIDPATRNRKSARASGDHAQCL